MYKKCYCIQIKYDKNFQTLRLVLLNKNMLYRVKSKEAFMEEKLWKIFENVNGWLKHAENKNRIVMGFVGVLSIILYLIENRLQLVFEQKILFTISYGTFLIAWISIIISLFPRTKISKKQMEEGGNIKLSDSDNLLFYGHILKYSIQEYKEKLIEKYTLKIEQLENLFIDDLIGQIIINSQITQWKYCSFKVSSISLGIGLLSFIISLISLLWS